MATHSGILACKILWTEEPGGLQSMGSQESDVTEWAHTHTLPTRFALSSGILGHFPHTQTPGDFITQIHVLSETFSWSKWCSGLKNWDFLLLASNSCLGYKSHFFLVLGVSCFDLRSILNQISLDRGEYSESIWFYMIQLVSTEVNSIQLATLSTCFETSPTWGTILPGKQRIKMHTEKMSRIHTICQPLLFSQL